MSRWFRFYDEAVNDPKLIKLSDDIFRAWVNLLCVASKNDGSLPATDDVAIILRVKVTRAAAIIAKLVSVGLLDRTETGFMPHNWDVRQYKSDVSTERVKRFRNGKRNVSETPPETEQKQNTEPEAEKKEPALRSDDWPKDYGDVFWAAYPRKTEKLSAMKKLATIRKSGIVTFADLMDGVRRYAAAGTEPQYTKHPTTWLNAGCWSDEIQSGGGNGYRSANTRTTGHDAILAAATREARKIVGDGDMAGSADATEFSFGPGPDGRTASGRHGAGRTDSAGHDGREPFSGPIIEGEVVPPDEADAGLPRGWRVVG